MIPPPRSTVKGRGTRLFLAGTRRTLHAMKRYLRALPVELALVVAVVTVAGAVGAGARRRGRRRLRRGRGAGR